MKFYIAIVPISSVSQRISREIGLRAQMQMPSLPSELNLHAARLSPSPFILTFIQVPRPYPLPLNIYPNSSDYGLYPASTKMLFVECSLFLYMSTLRLCLLSSPQLLHLCVHIILPNAYYPLFISEGCTDSNFWRNAMEYLAIVCRASILVCSTAFNVPKGKVTQ